MKASIMVQINPLDAMFDYQYLDILKRCGGYYKCPKDNTGKRLGPLVGYAGTYGPDKKHKVGDVYYNFAKAEEFPHVLHHFGRNMAEKIAAAYKFDNAPTVVLGAPMGGILLAGAIGRYIDCRVVFAEKKVTKAATKDSREQSELVLDRHDLEPGDTVLIVEDVCNNFTTTVKLLNLIEAASAYPVAIATFLNRSGETHYVTGQHCGGVQIPVECLCFIPTEQYRQDDPAVVADIAAGNVVWKPKNDWAILKDAMEKYGG